MNFNQDPEMAVLVAKILIKKGANLRAKNKNELGLLHVAVQAGTLKALKFAVDHNEHSRRRHRRPGLQPSDESLFHFNMQAGNNNWTLLHYAIQATNLSTITFLLDCNEKIDLTARDS
jgi:ankyrin repeat protein